MSGVDAGSFDLIDQPWILARAPQGDVRELSLMDLFTQAHTLECLVGDVPTQVFALTRLLLAVLHRATDGPKDLDQWEQLWSEPQLPVDLIKKYLERHRSRFDLLHPDTPFLQVADLHTAKGEVSDLSKLIADVPNGKPFFSTRLSPHLSIGFGEAARWIVHCHAFDPSGIKSGAVGDPRVKGGRGYPIGIGWSGWLGGVLVEGSDLRETLLLNLIAADFAGLAPWHAADRPAWERAPTGPDAESPDEAGEATGLGDRAPTGPLDLYTWQSRRIRLAWRGDVVTGVLICNGNKLMPQNRHRNEPHTAWQRSDAQEKKARGVVYMPRRHSPERAIWRGLQSLLPGANASQGRDAAPRLAPAVLSWLGYLSEEVLGPDHQVRVRTIGMTYGSQSSVTDDITDDALSLRALMLGRNALGLVGVAVACVQAAEDAARALGSLAGAIAAAQGGDQDSPRARARELAYNRLDVEFRDWLAGLASDTDAVQAQGDWHGRARRIVTGLGREELDRAPMAALTGRLINGRLLTSAHAEARFYWDLRSALPMAFGPTTEKYPDGPDENGQPQ